MTVLVQMSKNEPEALIFCNIFCTATALKSSLDFRIKAVTDAMPHIISSTRLLKIQNLSAVSLTIIAEIMCSFNMMSQTEEERFFVQYSAFDEPLKFLC